MHPADDWLECGIGIWDYQLASTPLLQYCNGELLAAFLVCGGRLWQLAKSHQHAGPGRHANQ